METKPYLRLAINNDNDNEENKVSVNLVTGGKTPTGGIDWLSDLEIGSIFLIQDRTSPDFNLGHFKLVSRTDKGGCILASTVLNQPIFVNPVRFCQKYMLFEHLGVFQDEHSEAVAAAEEEDLRETRDTLSKSIEEINKVLKVEDLSTPVK